jgi:tRNA-dihydrouridine synthase
MVLNTSSNRSSAELPWKTGTTPLMLAPLQGVTNRALRACFIDRVHPDTVFTEFMQARNQGAKALSASDRREAGAEYGGVPLVAQLIGHRPEVLVLAAQTAEEAGARHLNFNLGCPFGRHTTGLSGGALLSRPELLPEIIFALRAVINGSFSIKIRAGYNDLEQIFTLLPLFEEAQIDFLVLHPRTVVQKYGGSADHAITARVVERTALPVIANGDIVSAAQGRQILAASKAAGLMLGRGAIAEPHLFSRLRGMAPEEPSEVELLREFCDYLSDLLTRYEPLFCGEQQILAKLKEVPAFVTDLRLLPLAQQLRRARTLQDFRALLNN